MKRRHFDRKLKITIYAQYNQVKPRSYRVLQFNDVLEESWPVCVSRMVKIGPWLFEIYTCNHIQHTHTHTHTHTHARTHARSHARTHTHTQHNTHTHKKRESTQKRKPTNAKTTRLEYITEETNELRNFGQEIGKKTLWSSCSWDSRLNCRKLIPEAHHAFCRRHCLIEMTELSEKVADLLAFDHKQAKRPLVDASIHCRQRLSTKGRWFQP